MAGQPDGGVGVHVGDVIVKVLGIRQMSTSAIPEKKQDGETYGANGGVYTLRHKRVFQTRLTAFIATGITIANWGP